MDYMEFLQVVWDYILVFWEYLPWIAYAVAFLTLIPKVWRRVRIGAETELNEIKFHRCYGTDRCCHPLEAEEEVVRPRKKVLRRFAIKRELSEEKTEPPAHSPLPTLQTHVNQIAKMFEGNARKINRVTPILTNDTGFDVLSDELVPKKITSRIDEGGKYEKLALKNLEDRFFKPSPVGKPENIPENDENSVNLLNRLLTESSSSIPIPQRRHPSTSPSPPPRSLSRSRPASLKASIENIFALANKGSCSPGGPVTSIEEILSQRRLSRPLSAYSISDLLGDSMPDESYIDSVFGNLNK